MFASLGRMWPLARWLCVAEIIPMDSNPGCWATTFSGRGIWASNIHTHHKGPGKWYQKNKGSSLYFLHASSIPSQSRQTTHSFWAFSQDTVWVTMPSLPSGRSSPISQLFHIESTTPRSFITFHISAKHALSPSAFTNLLETRLTYLGWRVSYFRNVFILYICSSEWSCLFVLLLRVLESNIASNAL